MIFLQAAHSPARDKVYTLRQVLKEMRILLRRPLSLRGYRLWILTRAPSVHYPPFQHPRSISLCLRLDNNQGLCNKLISNLNLPLQSMNFLVSANDDLPSFGYVEVRQSTGDTRKNDLGYKAENRILHYPLRLHRMT
jgi:hypothetical protein